jgi:hypothetical protein
MEAPEKMVVAVLLTSNELPADKVKPRSPANCTF